MLVSAVILLYLVDISRELGQNEPMKNILVINGPNLNLLGSREPDLYGTTSLETLVDDLTHQANTLGYALQHVQSNAEHTLIDCIHAAKDNTNFIIINPAAFTHTSIACRDALLAVGIPFIEVHLSNVDGRESFRQTSFFSDIAVGKISGFGPYSYILALNAADHFLTHQPS